MAKKNEGGFPLNITQSALDDAKDHIAGRLRNLVLSVRASATDPGAIAGLVSDLMALEGISPTIADKPLPGPAKPIEEALSDQAKAQKAHEADENERMGRR